jgi:hypothetical protein
MPVEAPRDFAATIKQDEATQHNKIDNVMHIFLYFPNRCLFNKRFRKILKRVSGICFICCETGYNAVQYGTIRYSTVLYRAVLGGQGGQGPGMGQVEVNGMFSVRERQSTNVAKHPSLNSRWDASRADRIVVLQSHMGRCGGEGRRH